MAGCGPRCSGSGSGCSCVLEDGNCTRVNGLGSGNQPFSVDVVVADCPTNQAECVPPGGTSSDGECTSPAGGLYVPEPTVETGCGITGDGSSGDPLTALISAEDGNQTECHPGQGLYTPQAAGFAQDDSPTVNHTGDGTDASPLISHVRLSQCAGQLITALPDGLCANVDQVPTGCGLETVGGNLQVALRHDSDFRTAFIETHTNPDGCVGPGGCTSLSGESVYCDQNGDLRVPEFPFARSRSIRRGPTWGGCFDSRGGAIGGGFTRAGATYTYTDGGLADDPATGDFSQAHGSTGGGPEMAVRELSVLAIPNPSTCLRAHVTIDARGRTRLDTLPNNCWPAGVYSLGAQVNLGITVRGAVGGDFEFIVQRSQMDSNQPSQALCAENMARSGPNPDCGVSDSNKDAYNWLDFDTTRTFEIRPGGTITIDRWASVIWYATNTAGQAVLRSWLVNLPGITATMTSGAFCG